MAWAGAGSRGKASLYAAPIARRVTNTATRNTTDLTELRTMLPTFWSPLRFPWPLTATAQRRAHPTTQRVANTIATSNASVFMARSLRPLLDLVIEIWEEVQVHCGQPVCSRLPVGAVLPRIRVARADLRNVTARPVVVDA